jgi:hypothetical protein
VKNQSDTGFDLCIALDSLIPENVYEAVEEEFRANWYMADTGQSPSTIRINALRRISENYDIIVLVDSDDLLLPRRVERSKEYLETHDMSGCALELIDEEEKPLNVSAGRKFEYSNDTLHSFLLYRNIFGFSNTAYRSALLRRLLNNGFNSPLLDWNFATMSASLGARISFDRVPEMLYRQYGKNIARILPPFDRDIVLLSTLMVIEHLRGVLGSMPKDLREIYEKRYNEVNFFHGRLSAAPEVCNTYIEALNTLTEERYWWSFVANPALEEIWK